jgi:hypothetical protein
MRGAGVALGGRSVDLELQSREGAVGASGELAGDADDGPLGAAAQLDREIERMVWAARLAGVVGGLDQRLPQLRRAAWSGGRGAWCRRLGHGRVKPGDAHDLAGAPEAAGVADLGQDLGGRAPGPPQKDDSGRPGAGPRGRAGRALRTRSLPSAATAWAARTTPKGDGETEGAAWPPPHR